MPKCDNCGATLIEPADLTATQIERRKAENPMGSAELVQQFVEGLLLAAEEDGWIVEVDRVPGQPLAMRNHKARVRVYPKR